VNDKECSDRVSCASDYREIARIYAHNDDSVSQVAPYIMTSRCTVSPYPADKSMVKYVGDPPAEVSIVQRGPYGSTQE
jgi:hypothetical protein